MKVLIVDDYPANRKLLTLQLQDEGDQLYEAGDGLQALDILTRENIGFLISDILMPKMDGYRLCQEVRKRPGFVSLPILVYSSTYLSPSDQKLAFDCGADRFLAKPASGAEIVKTIREMKAFPTSLSFRRVPIVEEIVILKDYNEALIAKLEETNMKLETRTVELEQNEAKMTEIANNLQEVIFMVGPSGTSMNYISPAYETVWGRSRQSLYEQPLSWQEALHPEDRLRVEQWTRNHMADTGSTTYRIIRPDGTIRWIEAHTYPVKNDAGDIIRFVGRAVDISDRIRLENIVKQSEKLAAMGQVAAGVAHELNNPIAVILGFAESLIRHSPADDLLRAPYESIQREASRCKHLVQELLIFSRSNKSEFKLETLSDAVEGALALAETLAKTRRVQIVRAFASELPLISIDRNQIQQAVINLCTNAMDAMPSGGTLTVGTALGEGHVELRVTDTGTGIPPELLERIFEPFFTTKEEGKGTGLGLALIAEIAKKHNAAVDLKTDMGKGTTFFIRFPTADLLQQRRAA